MSMTETNHGFDVEDDEIDPDEDHPLGLEPLDHRPMLTTRLHYAGKYHTHRCRIVRAKSDTLREETRRSIDWHDLTLCPYCGGNIPHKEDGNE